jgi:hypothetical protein
LESCEAPEICRFSNVISEEAAMLNTEPFAELVTTGRGTPSPTSVRLPSTVTVVVVRY